MNMVFVFTRMDCLEMKKSIVDNFKNPTWSKFEIDNLINLYNKGYSIKQISFILARSCIAVRLRLNFHGLTYKSYYTEKEKRFFLSSAGKMTVMEMARISGRSALGINYFLVRNGVSGKCYGDVMPFTKHSDADVLLMRQLYDDGVSLSDIAEKFEIPYYTAKRLAGSCSTRKLAIDYLFKEFKSKDKRVKRRLERNDNRHW